MALKQVLVDDMTGDEGATTRRFSLDGSDYEIDLNTANGAKLEKALAPFIEAGRKAGHKRRVGVTKVTKPTSTTDKNAIRAWARKSPQFKGRKISDRGRVPQDVVDAFNEADEAARNGTAVPAFSG